MTQEDTEDDARAVFNLLREMQAACRRKANKHDTAYALISVCIQEGWDTGPRIIRALEHIGMNPRHVAIILKEGAGGNPEAHWWQRNSDGHYCLHDEQLAPQPQA